LAVIVDVNVFVSAALSSKGPSATLVRALLDGSLEVVALCRLKPDQAPGAAVLRDHKDDYLVFLVRAVDADCIVSGDADLTDASLEPPALTPRDAVTRFGLS